jgi:serine/threonine-protein kinase haspin
MDAPAHGVGVTLIDLGLARMDAGGGTRDARWTAPEPETFDGTGEYQYDVYRMMRAHVGDDWAQFRPLTNVMVRREPVRSIFSRSLC